jgi:sigma-E factor negative regulatory protein RseC
MPETKTIQHKGFIDSITEEGILVKFISQSACADCHAKGVCSAADMKDKELWVRENSPARYKVGEAVNILMTSYQGSQAVLIGYVYPFALFLLFLLILSAVGLGEVSAGLISLAVLIPYYSLIYIFREKINKKFSFTIRKES